MPSDNPYIDPNDPNMGSQDPGQSSAAQSTGQLEDLNRQLAANPQVQAFIRSRGGRALTDADQQQYQQLIQSLGYSMLPNTRIDPSGAIVPNNSDVRNRLLVAAFAWPLAAAGIQALGGAAAASPNAGLAGAGYTVPGATLGAAGGAPGVGGLAGLAGADYVVPGAALNTPSTLGARRAITTIPTVTSRALPTGGNGIGLPNVSNLLRYGVPAVGSYLSTRTQNNANNDATQFLQDAVMQGQQIAGNIYGNQMDLFGSARDGALGAYGPYQQVGQQGLATLAGLAGQNRPDFRLPTLQEAQAMPGYQFGLDQGIKGVNASAAARGGLLTGGAVKAAERYATDYATSKYGELANQKLAEYGINTANFERPWNRAMGLADLGRFGASGAANAYSDYATQAGRAGTAYGDQVTDLLTAGANANAGTTATNGNNSAGNYRRLAE